METLVVIGSLGRDKRSYYRLVETVPEEWKIYVLSYNDILAQGNVEKVSDNILRVLEKENIRSCIFLGHSLGGAFALQFASDNPEKVKKLILVDSLGIANKKSFLSLFFNQVRVHLGNILIAKNLRTIYKIEWITTWDIFTHPVLYIRVLRYIVRINLENLAKKIHIPTLIIWGEHDYLTPLADGKKLHQLMKNSQLIILKGLNHEWILHYPEKLWNLL